MLLRDRIIPLVRFGSLLGSDADLYRSGNGRPGGRPPHAILPTGARRIIHRQCRRPRYETRRWRADRSNTGQAPPQRGSALEIAVVTTGTMQYGAGGRLLSQHRGDRRQAAGTPSQRPPRIRRGHDPRGRHSGPHPGRGRTRDQGGPGRCFRVRPRRGTGGRGGAGEARRPSIRCSFSTTRPMSSAPSRSTPCCASSGSTPAQVEMAGSRRTMQYRGASLPLVTLSDAAQVKPIGETKDLAVIVSSVHGREVGLLGAMPVDVIETKAAIDQATHRQKGIAGSAIIRDRTTLIADVFELVDAVYPEWGEARAAVPSRRTCEKGRIVRSPGRGFGLFPRAGQKIPRRRRVHRARGAGRRGGLGDPPPACR